MPVYPASHRHAETVAEPADKPVPEFAGHDRHGDTPVALLYMPGEHDVHVSDACAIVPVRPTSHRHAATDTEPVDDPVPECAGHGKHGAVPEALLY